MLGLQAREHRRPEGAGLRIRLVLADDHQSVLEEIRRLLEPEFQVLETAGDGISLLEAAADLRPDVIVTDVQMPRMTGIQAAEQLHRRGLSPAVVALSVYHDAHLVNAALKAGIRGYVLKVDAGEELIPAIYAALRGERYLSAGVHGEYGG